MMNKGLSILGATVLSGWMTTAQLKLMSVLLIYWEKQVTPTKC